MLSDFAVMSPLGPFLNFRMRNIFISISLYILLCSTFSIMVNMTTPGVKQVIILMLLIYLLHLKKLHYNCKYIIVLQISKTFESGILCKDMWSMLLDRAIKDTETARKFFLSMILIVR